MTFLNSGVTGPMIIKFINSVVRSSQINFLKSCRLKVVVQTHTVSHTVERLRYPDLKTDGN